MLANNAIREPTAAHPCRGFGHQLGAGIGNVARDNAGECLVDCDGLGSWISDLTGGFLDSGTISAACGGAGSAAGQVATQLIATIKFKTDVLDFSGHAAIGRVGDDESACSTQANCAGQLGTDTFDRDLRKNPSSRDGTWTGGFFDDILKNMPGSWESKRQQFR